MGIVTLTNAPLGGPWMKVEEIENVTVAVVVPGGSADCQPILGL